MSWSCVYVYTTAVDVASGDVVVPAAVLSAASNGDLIIAGLSWASTTGFTPPTGWNTAVAVNDGNTLTGNTTSIRSGGIYWIEKSGTVADTFARTGGSVATAAYAVYRWGGVAGTITLDTTSSNTTTQTTASTTGALTVANADSLIVLLSSARSVGVTNISATAPSTYVSRANATTFAADIWQQRRADLPITAPQTQITLSDAQKSASGSTGTITVTHNVSRLHKLLAAAFYVAGGGGTTNYEIDGDVGSYSITGTAAGLTSARKMAADAGAYALTGTDANLSIGRRLTADPGSYSLTGTAAGLTSSRRMTGDAGSYSIVGTDAGLTSARRIDAGAGSYALTGQSASFTAVRNMVAEAGAYSVNGQSATLIYSAGAVQYAMTGEAGSYVIAGQDAAIRSARTMGADGGAYVLTGQSATLTYDMPDEYGMDAEAGSYQIVGTPADLSYRISVASRPLFFIIG